VEELAAIAMEPLHLLSLLVAQAHCPLACAAAFCASHRTPPACVVAPGASPTDFEHADVELQFAYSRPFHFASDFATSVGDFASIVRC